MKTWFMFWMQRSFAVLPQSIRALGPYLLVELVLPGGSLLALLLWLYNHKLARA